MTRANVLVVVLALLAALFVGAAFGEREYVRGVCPEGQQCVTYGVMYGDKVFEPIAAAIAFPVALVAGAAALRWRRRDGRGGSA